MQIRALFINGALHSINIYSNIGERDKKIQIFFKWSRGGISVPHLRWQRYNSLPSQGHGFLIGAS